MNIYEQLNKINDEESLSEKYNVKNAKELKNLKEDMSTWEPDNYEDYAYAVGARDDETIWDVEYDIDFDDSRHNTWADVRKGLIWCISRVAKEHDFNRFPSFEVWLSARGELEPIWCVSVHSVAEAKALIKDIKEGKYQ